MTKPFNIHDWQAKHRLTEQDEFQKRQDALTPGKNPDAFFGDDSLMNKTRGDWKAPPMGMSPGEKSQESMSNASIKALQVVIGDHSLNKILNTIAVIVDKTGKHDEADMIQKLASQMQDFNVSNLDEKEGVPHYTKDGKEWKGKVHKMPNGKLMTQNPHNEDSEELFHKEDLDEMNTTGGGASFNSGAGEGYMTPNAFKKKKKK